MQLDNLQISQISKKKVKRAREFCLKIIKDVYDIDYTPEWHSDLDSLLSESGDYSLNNNGAFFIVELGNKIVGTIGVRTLATKPQLVSRFKYKDAKKVASIWRAYISDDLRGQGLGSKLYTKAESFIKKQGLKKIYLHTSRLNPQALNFWLKQGFQIIKEEDNSEKTVHMQKNLS